MLKLLRNKNVAKTVLWGLLILILPAFVLWGAGSLGRSKDKGPSYVGLVNGKKISFDNFAAALSSTRCQLILNYSNNPQMLEALFNDRQFMGRLAWDRIILDAQAKRHRIKVPDREVVNYIRSHPIFLRNGKFDDRIYDYFLKHSVGLDARSFEEVVRENLAIQKMNDLLTKDIKVTDEEILGSYRKNPDEVTETQRFDEERFKKEKDEYSKKALVEKKNQFLEILMTRLESKAKLNIDIADYEKYYRQAD